MVLHELSSAQQILQPRSATTGINGTTNVSKSSDNVSRLRQTAICEQPDPGTIYFSIIMETVGPDWKLRSGLDLTHPGGRLHSAESLALIEDEHFPSARPELGIGVWDASWDWGKVLSKMGRLCSVSC